MDPTPSKKESKMKVEIQAQFHELTESMSGLRQAAQRARAAAAKCDLEWMADMANQQADSFDTVADKLEAAIRVAVEEGQ